MASGDLTTQSLTAAATEYNPGFLSRAISAVVGKIFFSAATNRKPAVMAAARRSAAAADTGTFVSYGSSKIDAGMSMFTEASCRFSAPSQSATIMFLLFDEAGTFMDYTPDYTFNSESSLLIDTGVYGSARQHVDLGGASYYYPFVRVAPASGTVDIYAENL
jgi:hypothetical protein